MSLGTGHDDVQRTCTRLVGYEADSSERLCGIPAIVHVDWGPESGFVCELHAEDALERGWQAADAHVLGPCCGMPGARWFPNYGESFCAYADGLPVAQTEERVAA